jgi:hypothetical protein
VNGAPDHAHALNDFCNKIGTKPPTFALRRLRLLRGVDLPRYKRAVDACS